MEMGYFPKKSRKRRKEKRWMAEYIRAGSGEDKSASKGILDPISISYPAPAYKGYNTRMEQG